MSTKTTYRVTKVQPALGWGHDRPYSEQDARAARSLIGRRFGSLDAAAEAYRELGLDQHGDVTLAEESERGGTWSITTEQGWRGHSPRRAHTEESPRRLTEAEIQRVLQRAREVGSWPHIRGAMSALTEPLGSPNRLAIAKALGVDAR